MPYPSTGENIEKKLTDVQKFQGQCFQQNLAELKNTCKFYIEYLYVKRMCKLTCFCVINPNTLSMRVKN